jgi:3-oxoacyl-[acyl-carrier protein] reductase
VFDLSGKCALITGASGRIGSAVARALHCQGATVAVSGTRREALDSLVQELGDRVHAIPCDLSDPDAVEALIGEAEGVMEAVEIVVNNAGITRDSIAVRLKDEAWQQVIDVNLTAAFRISRGALRGMMRRRWGRIINMTSVVGVSGNAGQANYAAAKAGLIGLSKSLAQEVASRSITVNCVAPGFIETAMTEALEGEQRDRLAAAIPAGRFGVSSDVASAVVYLASDEASYVTGHTLHVNGGMVMV